MMPLQQNNRLTILVILVISLGLTLLGFTATLKLNKQQSLNSIHSQAEIALQAIEQHLKWQIEAVSTMSALFEVSEIVDQATFSRFAKVQFLFRPTIMALEWVPRVEHDYRPEFERRAQEFYPDFSFTEMDENERLVTAGEREFYYPVYFVEPFKGNEKAIGFDLGSNKIRKQALENATTSRGVIVSRRVNLVQDESLEYGFLVIKPITRKNQDTISSFILGVFTLSDILETIETSFPGFNFYLYDIIDENTGIVLYPKQKTQKNHTDFDHELCNSHIFSVADKYWKVISCAKNPPIAYSLTAYIILFMGIALTLLISIHLANISNRSRFIESEIHKQTRKLKRSNKALYDENSFFHELLHRLNYSLRTTINNITGSVELLENTSLNTSQTKTINIIKRSTDQMIDIINESLRNDHQSLTKVQLETAPVDIIQLCHESIAMVNHDLESKDITVKLDTSKNNIAMIEADGRRLRYVITQLLAYAIHNCTGKTITLNLEVMEEATEFLTMNINIRFVGEQLPMTLIRGDSDTNSYETDNTEAELEEFAIGHCKNLIELMRGKLYINSDREKQISMIIPFVFANINEQQSAHGDPDSRNYQRRVLLVEDDLMNLVITRFILEKLGITVITASNGEEAINTLITLNHKLDLIIMDIDMPIMNGIEATRGIRDSLKNPIPIIALSAYTYKNEELEGLQAGMNMFLKKPLQLSSLIKALDTYLDQ